MPPEDFNEKIELLVNDENRIVTYKILSQELKIHVNKAKQCLMDFLNTQKSKGFSLDVHYFLAGFVEKDGVRSVKVAIVSEDKLEIAKKNYIELTSFHVYSIYKGAAKDECALYSADFTYTKDKDELNKYSAIKHPNIEIQPPFLNKIPIKSDVRLPIKNDSKSSLPKKAESTISANGSLSNDVAKPKINENGVSPEKTDALVENQKENSKKTTPDDKKPKSGTLMSMWQKKEEKQNGAKKEKSETKGKQAAKPVPKNNIMSMFSKQAVKNAEKPPVLKSVAPKEDESPKSVSPVSVNSVNKEDSIKTAKTQEKRKSSQKRKASNHTSRKASKTVEDSDSETEFQPKAKKNKKHKRICTFDTDSESENEEEKEKAQRSFFLPEEPMDAAPATPVTDDEEPIPPTPPVINVKGKAKIWKTVQKTYEDEEGFFVTKTEKELVSASEGEEEPIKVQPAKKEEEIIKKTSSVNKKQASLMSFFKQK